MQPLEVFYEKGVLKNFAKFTEKRQYWSLFLTTRLQASGFATLLKRAFNVFSCKFWETFKKTLFTEHLQVATSGCYSIQLFYPELNQI